MEGGKRRSKKCAVMRASEQFLIEYDGLAAALSVKCGTKASVFCARVRVCACVCVRAEVEQAAGSAKSCNTQDTRRLYLVRRSSRSWRRPRLLIFTTSAVSDTKGFKTVVQRSEKTQSFERSIETVGNERTGTRNIEPGAGFGRAHKKCFHSYKTLSVKTRYVKQE